MLSVTLWNFSAIWVNLCIESCHQRQKNPQIMERQNILLLPKASCSVPLYFSVVWNEHQDLVLSALVRVKVSLPLKVNKVFDLHLWANVIISIWIIPSDTRHECMRHAHDCELMSPLLETKGSWQWWAAHQQTLYWQEWEQLSAPCQWLSKKICFLPEHG